MGSRFPSAREAGRRAAQPLLGKETPRIFTPPLRELTPETTDGFSVIDFAETVLKVRLLPWQKWLLIHMLELREDGRYRFRIIVVLVARQNGKSTVSQVLALWWLFVAGRQEVLGTAQDLDTAEDVWLGAVELAQEVPALNAEIKTVRQVNGKKALILLGGEKYRVKAANRRAGRGLSGEGIMLDELREHQDWHAWSAITKTTMARPNAQIVCLSNAGDSTSVVLWSLRKRAHAALGDPDGIVAAEEALKRGVEFDEDADEQPVDVDPLAALGADDLFLAEWSSTPGCSVYDRDEWAQSNPSLNHTEFGDVVTEETMASAARDPEHVFRPENLCQWITGSVQSVFPGASWAETTDVESRIVGPVVACIDMSATRQWTFVAFAGHRLDGKVHVEIVARRGGDEWVKDWLAARAGRITAVTGQWNGAPISATIRGLEFDHLRPASDPLYFPIPVLRWEGSELGAGFGLIHDGIRDGKVWHLPQPVLDIAAAFARTRRSGDGQILDRTASEVDIASLVSATGAVWLLSRPVPAAQAPSAYESRGLEVV